MATFVKHEACPSCGSRDNLGRYSDGSAFCFGCHYYEPSTTSPFVGERDGKSKRSTVREGVVFPEDATSVLDSRGCEWLCQYGITPEEALRAGFRWSNFWEQLLMPLRGSDGKVCCIQAKNFNPQRASKAKYYNVGDKSQSVTTYGWGDTLVLTEDILSAMKVSKHYRGMPLLGTHISRSRLIQATHEMKRLVVWLDEDKWREAREIADAAKMYGIVSKTILTPKDPKEYSDDEIKEIVS